MPTVVFNREKPTYGRASPLVFCMILAITIAVLNRGNVLPSLERSIADAAIALLPLLGLTLSMRQLSHRQLPPLAITIAIAYALTVVLSGIINGPGMASALGLLLPAVNAVVLVTVGSLLTAAEFQTIARWLITLAVIQAGLAVAEVQMLEPWAKELASPDGFYPYRPNLVISGIGRANGTMGHPILLGLVCTVGAILTFSKQIVSRWYFQVPIIAALFLGILLSGSRSSITAFLVASMIYFLHPASPTRPWLRVLMVLWIVPLTVIYVQDAVANAREVSLFSLTNRLDALPRLGDTFSRPFPQWFVGDGISFSLETVADNQFLSSSGFYGLLGFLTFSAGVIFGLYSRNPLTVAALSSLVFMSLSFDTLTWAFSTFMIWFLIGYGHSPSGRPGDMRAGTTNLSADVPGVQGTLPDKRPSPNI